VEHFNLLQIKKADDNDYVIRNLWTLKPYKEITSQTGALQFYTAEDAPAGITERTVISEWFSYTYKNRVYKMCYICGRIHYRGLGMHTFILYGTKTVLNNEEYILFAKNPDNWCHLCFTESLFSSDLMIHKRDINQQKEFIMVPFEITHSYRLGSSSWFEHEKWLYGR